MGLWAHGHLEDALALCLRVCYVHAVGLRCGPCIYATRDP